MRRPDRLLTNSRASAADIARVHGREAEVVHPPVNTSFFTPGPGPGRHALAVARAVPHKRLDLLVEAFRDLDEELVVVGHGRELPKLRAAAPANVRFTGFVPDEQLADLYRDSFALVCPSIEEFGIAMAEAHACGIPVIAPAAGGALEIVDDPATGILLDRVDPATLASAVRAARRRAFDPEACRASAERFSDQRFAAQIERVVDDELRLGREARHGLEPALVPG
jgi:glycosyltransferase involved in cell wall biosynthesis